MWTFHQSTFLDAIEKVDSAAIKYIEAFPGQELGGISGTFDLNMSKETRDKLKEILKAKGIKLLALGVIVPPTVEEWRRNFEFAREFGIEYITAEPLPQHWDTINTLAGEYNIMIAIHDHPRPSRYDHPDSVLIAIKGRKNLGACADLGHWARNGLDVVECLKILEGRIIGIHLKDVDTFNNVGAKDVILGKGVIPFTEVFSELKRQKFNGMFAIEHERLTDSVLFDVKENKVFFERMSTQ